jgi:hypothetical protein
MDAACLVESVYPGAPALPGGSAYGVTPNLYWGV